MYGTLQQDANLTQLRQVKVDVIANRPGQILRNYLLDSMTEDSSAGNKYILHVTLTETKKQLGLRRDETSSYQELYLTATLRLENLTSGETEFTDTVTQVASYSLGSTAESATYAADVSEEASRAKTLKIMADDITLHVASYLIGKAAKYEG